MTGKPSVFISYRRSDSSAVAGRIYDRLTKAFGKSRVFKDSYNIPHGADFRGVIRKSVSQCDVVLVIIGQQWLTVTEGTPPKRRLDNPNDWVRFEIETGLEIETTHVIPVLVQNTSMPPADKLPESIRELAYKNALTIRDDPDFDTDVARLIQGMQQGRSVPMGLLTIGIVILLLAIIGFILLSNRGGENPSVASNLTDMPTEIPTSDTPLPIFTATETLAATATLFPSATATEPIDFGATATEAILQRTVGAQEATNAALIAENTQIAASATEAARPTITNTPSDTPTQTVSPTQPPTATLNIPVVTGTPGYPCDARVVSRATAILLNVVRSMPRSNATLRSPIQTNTAIKIIRKIDENDVQSWYQINDTNGVALGWIPIEFVILSDTCPLD